MRLSAISAILIGCLLGSPGDPPAITRAEAEAVFAGKYPVFDWPELQSTGVATTILNARREPPVVQRMGPITPLEIMRIYDRW